MGCTVTGSVYSHVCQPPKQNQAKHFLIAKVVTRGKVCHSANSSVAYMLTASVRSPPVLERGTYLAGLNCELCPASTETPAFSRHSSTKGGLSPTTAGSPVPKTSGNVWQCLHSAVAFFQSSKFYPKWDAVILMKWTLPQDTTLAGICLPRAVTPGQPFPHRREAPFHHFWCGVCPEHQHAPSSREINLFLSYHPSIYSASKQQWWLNSCRLLIVMILAPTRFSGQPSSLKSVSGH